MGLAIKVNSLQDMRTVLTLSEPQSDQASRGPPSRHAGLAAHTCDMVQGLRRQQIGGQEVEPGPAKVPLLKAAGAAPGTRGGSCCAHAPVRQ